MSLNLELVALAEKIALSAGELLLDRPSKFELDEKSGALDFATQKDHQSESLIVSQILAQRPLDGLIGEEGANKESESGVTWVIDPIDGTVNYLYDLPVGASVSQQRIEKNTLQVWSIRLQQTHSGKHQNQMELFLIIHQLSAMIQ